MTMLAFTESGNSPPVCGKPVRKATNGADRGTCIWPKGHFGMHGNRSCYKCGVVFSSENTAPSILEKGCGACRACDKEKHRAGRVSRGLPPPQYKTPQASQAPHTFPCGCVGMLPERGQSNRYAKWCSSAWRCRVTCIIRGNNNEARSGNYAPIDRDTPHSAIRAMMEEPNCERCGLPLSWEIFSNATTPHCHHNHQTGEIYGFTHPRCNPNALEIEIDRLKDENALLKAALCRAGIAA
jgi:hypothetical protein